MMRSNPFTEKLAFLLIFVCILLTLNPALASPKTDPDFSIHRRSANTETALVKFEATNKQLLSDLERESTQDHHSEVQKMHKPFKHMGSNHRNLEELKEDCEIYVADSKTEAPIIRKYCIAYIKAYKGSKYMSG